jgi:hypothetical protein
MAGSSLFQNLARGAKVIALLLFLLPWVTVSCSPQAFSDSLRSDMRRDTGIEASLPPGPRGLSGGSGCVLLSASGLQLAIGSATPRNDCFAGLPADGQDTRRSNDNPFETPNIAVIVAAALLLLALLASFVLKGAARAVVGAGGSLIAAGAIFYAVMIQAPALVRASFTQGGASGAARPGGMPPEQLEQMIRTEPASGFWIVLVMLVLAVVLNLLAMRKPGAAAPVAAPTPAATPPPPAEPPAGT